MHFSGAALKCWACNSLEIGNCADEFDPEKLTDVERRHFLQDCLTVPLGIRKLNITTRPVCRKMITKSECWGCEIESPVTYWHLPPLFLIGPLAGERRVFSRMCFYENESQAPDSCKLESKKSPILEVEFCESCTTDGCNSGSYLLPLVTLMALPIMALIRQH